LEEFSIGKVYIIFKTSASPHQNVVSIMNFFLHTETYFGFQGETSSIILDMWERSSSAYSLVGLRNNKVFTYFMDTSNSANDVGLDVAPSVSISTSYDL